MKDFLLTMWKGFLFIAVVAIIMLIGLGFWAIIIAFVPKTVIVIVGTIAFLWFVGAVAR